MNRLTSAVFVLAITACGPGIVPPRDVRVTPPKSDPAKYYEVLTPEQVIPAGTERMFCTDLIYRGDPTPFTTVDTYQGKFAHHLILMSTTKPKPEGTTYECSDIQTMKDMSPFAIPLDLPPGYANFMPTGTPLVVQMHYVNTSKDDILVRDFIRLTKVPESSVSHWAAPFAANTSTFKLMPHSTDGKVVFDCAMTKEVDLMLLGGHMHEHGSSFKTEIGPDVDHLTTRYEVTTWKPDYRDSPPVELFTSKPIHLSKGDVIRTTCVWANSTDHAIEFPEEMCASFGVIGETKVPWVCGVGTPL